MDGGDWGAAVYEVEKSWTRLKGLSLHACTSLHCCMSFSLVVASGGYSLVAVRSLLVPMASPVAEHGL